MSNGDTQITDEAYAKRAILTALRIGFLAMLQTWLSAGWPLPAPVALLIGMSGCCAGKNFLRRRTIESFGRCREPQTNPAPGSI